MRRDLESELLSDSESGSDSDYELAIEPIVEADDLIVPIVSFLLSKPLMSPKM